MIPTVNITGNRNPDIVLTLPAIRAGWKLDECDRDLYRLSRKDDVIVIHAPAIRAGHQITVIHSNKMRNTHEVNYFVIPENFTREDLSQTIGNMFMILMPDPV
jgi:ATP-dependent 26S proteasome regulatory subunit